MFLFFHPSPQLPQHIFCSLWNRFSIRINMSTHHIFPEPILKLLVSMFSILLFSCKRAEVGETGRIGTPKRPQLVSSPSPATLPPIYYSFGSKITYATGGNSCVHTYWPSMPVLLSQVSSKTPNPNTSIALAQTNDDARLTEHGAWRAKCHKRFRYRKRRRVSVRSRKCDGALSDQGSTVLLRSSGLTITR